jgi:hypothetical protein
MIFLFNFNVSNHNSFKYIMLFKITMISQIYITKLLLKHVYIYLFYIYCDIFIYHFLRNILIN